MLWILPILRNAEYRARCYQEWVILLYFGYPSNILIHKTALQDFQRIFYFLYFSQVNYSLLNLELENWRIGELENWRIGELESKSSVKSVM